MTKNPHASRCKSSPSTATATTRNSLGRYVCICTLLLSTENDDDPLQFKPDPHRARRGGGRARDRHWHPSVCLPKRAINYDLAESFMDHSTNPLSSDLYKVRFHHSNKQWPNGRFMSYKEKLDKLDGNIVEISCTRTFALVPKRKKMIEIQPVDPPSIVPPPILPVDPVVQEQKKKQVDKQTHFYANLFGCGKIPRVTIAEDEYRWGKNPWQRHAAHSCSLHLIS